jgi:hypothetical protein
MRAFYMGRVTARWRFLLHLLAPVLFAYLLPRYTSFCASYPGAARTLDFAPAARTDRAGRSASTGYSHRAGTLNRAAPFAPSTLLKNQSASFPLNGAARSVGMSTSTLTTMRWHGERRPLTPQREMAVYVRHELQCIENMRSSMPRPIATRFSCDPPRMARA